MFHSISKVLSYPNFTFANEGVKIYDLEFQNVPLYLRDDQKKAFRSIIEKHYDLYGAFEVEDKLNYSNISKFFSPKSYTFMKNNEE